MIKNNSLLKLTFLLIPAIFLPNSSGSEIKSLSIALDSIGVKVEKDILGTREERIEAELLETPSKKVAVVVLVRDTTISKLGEYLCDGIESQLVGKKLLEILDNNILYEISEERGLSFIEALNPSELQKTGIQIGLDAVIYGKIKEFKEYVKVTIKSMRPKSGTIMGVKNINIEKDRQVIELMNKILYPEEKEEKEEQQITLKEKPEKRVEKTGELEKKEFIRGITAEYFNLYPFTDNPGALTGEPNFTRIDNSIDFDWNRSSPAKSISVDYFGVRWTGMIKLPNVTGTYLFKIIHDDGIRFILDNKVIIENWHPGLNSHSKEIYLEGGGWHPVNMEFFDLRGNAVIHLYWRPPGYNKAKLIPSTNFRTIKKEGYED